MKRRASLGTGVTGARLSERGENPGKGCAIMGNRVLILGVALVASNVDAARKVIAGNLAKGYNNAKPGEPGFWTWESMASEAYAGLGVAFPSTDTARETGRLTGAAMRGVIPNGAARWASVTPDAETVDLILGMLVATWAIHGARASGKSVAVSVAETSDKPAAK